MISPLGAGGATAVRSAAYEFTHDELGIDPLRLRGQVTQGGIAAVRSDDAAVVAAAMRALDGWAAEVRLLPAGVPVPTDDAVVVEPSPASAPVEPQPGSEPTRWILYTSGTTGEPKPISHSLDSLSRTVATGAASTLTWGLLYDPNRMAGVQVLVQALLTGATVIAPSLDETLATRIATLVDAGVDAVSATPTLWRQVLQLPASRDWDLRQITVGGEIADQAILNALAASFPDARIVHIFASTETGAAFSVKDGRAGFPARFLDEPPRGIKLEIRDDILHVHSPGASAAGPDGFASTGDVVEVDDDRVFFRGRASGVVNIGGANVWPEVVESLLREHPDVLDAVVSSKPNPMTGNVLVARVTLDSGADRDGVSKRLRSWVRGKAPGTHVPASVSVVDDVGVSTTGKAAR